MGHNTGAGAYLAVMSSRAPQDADHDDAPMAGAATVVAAALA